jgi:ribosomal protein L40E
MPHDVIVSYATIDKPTADAVCAKLEERGIRCWIAPRDILPGADYAASIISAIDSAKLMVLIFSSHANASKHVMREAERAVHSAIPIIPFRIEDIQPSPSLQYYISGQHWLDALTPPLEQHIFRLVEAIKVLIGDVKPPEKRCEQCGAANPPNASFCEACGVSFAGRPREQRTPAGQAAPSSPLLRNRTVIVAIVAVIAVVLIGSGLYASGVFNGGSPSPSPSGNPTTSVGSTITYQNSTIGVQFSYPQTWIVSSNPTNAGNLSDRYYAMWPPLPAGVNSTVDTRLVGFFYESAAPYTGASGKVTFELNSFETDNNYTNVIVVENVTPTTFGGMPAYEAVWSYHTVQNPGTPYYMKQIWTVKGDYLYGIIYSSGQNYYSTSLPQVEQIINSFKFM